MARRKIAGLLLFATAIFGTDHAEAWGPDGHAIVAAIAEARLDPAVRAQVAQSSVWTRVAPSTSIRLPHGQTRCGRETRPPGPGTSSISRCESSPSSPPVTALAETAWSRRSRALPASSRTGAGHLNSASMRSNSLCILSATFISRFTARPTSQTSRRLKGIEAAIASSSRTSEIAPIFTPYGTAGSSTRR